MHLCVALERILAQPASSYLGGQVFILIFVFEYFWQNASWFLRLFDLGAVRAACVVVTHVRYR